SPRSRVSCNLRFVPRQPGRIAQEFSGARWRKRATNEKLHRPPQIERCGVQIAKSFKAQSPPLPWVPIKQDLGDFYIAAALWERGVGISTMAAPDPSYVRSHLTFLTITLSVI